MAPNFSPDRVRRILAAVSGLAESARADRLRELCGGDDALRREVEALLDDTEVQVTRFVPGDPALEDEWQNYLSRFPRARGHLIRVDEIARGGMGTVVRVYDPCLRRHLAMKRLEGATAAGGDRDARRLGRFLEEAQVTAQLDHPGVVPIHEIGIDEDGAVFFTMKLVRGRDLRKIIELSRSGEEGWNPTRVLHVLLRASEAIAFAHKKGVIHRDLKPSNIMVGRYGETYVMDWGLARVASAEEARRARAGMSADSLPSVVVSDRRRQAEDTDGSSLDTMDGDVIGTPAYMAPEQARGELDRLGVRTDVYAMGAILYHVLTGQPPYVPKGARLSQLLVLRFVLEGPPSPVSRMNKDAPAELVSICEKAMARDPERRYATMDEFAEDLRAFLEHRVVRAYETGAGAEFRKWVLRNRVAATVAAVALIALLVTSGLFMHRLRRQTAVALQNEALARRQSQESDRLRAVAEAERARTQAVADLWLMEQLGREVDSLWPLHPDRVPAMRDWLQRASHILSHRSIYESLLASESGSAEGGVPLEDVLSAMDRFEGRDGEDGPVVVVSKRLARAESLERDSIERYRDAWVRACLEIAENPVYGGLRLAPQLGLVPLGEDPVSGLQEFAHISSGAIPERGEKGRLRPAADSAIVLVLVPGGGFVMGAQSDDEEEPNYDPAAADDEMFTHRVELDPFFIGKYEVSQAQWEAMAGSNPSMYKSPTLPVEHVNWYMAHQVLSRYGLQLPTEAQWEYAARAGTDTPFWTGRDRRDLPRAANIGDVRVSRMVLAEREVDLDDGFSETAPIGSFQPNPFGLHDVMGNVLEWCADAYLSYYIDPDPGTGLRHSESQDPTKRVMRGGSFADPSPMQRVSGRWNVPAEAMSAITGLRAARAIDDGP